MQCCLSFRGLRSLDPHQGSALNPLGGLTATPRSPAEFSNDFWSLHVVPMAQLPEDWEFSFFHIGTGILDYFDAGNWDPNPPHLQDPRPTLRFYLEWDNSKKCYLEQTKSHFWHPRADMIPHVDSPRADK